MKKFITFLIILACILSVPITAFAISEAPEQAQDDILYSDKEPQVESPISDEVPESSDVPVDESTYNEEPKNNESPRLADGKYSNMGELFEYWEANGYPDYVGDVFSTDGSMNNLTVLLVGDDDTKAEQIRSSLVDDSGVSFGKAIFSHNTLKTVNDEIVANYLGKDDKVYSVSTGWTSVDGKVTGFGESGKESRVVVSVDESVSTEYANKFHKLYGDMVVVEAGDAVIPQDDISSSNVWLLPLLISMTIIAGVSILFFNRTRLIPAMQTTKGAVVTQSVPVSRKETIAAIKNSEIAPSNEMFNSILRKIDKDGG